MRSRIRSGLVVAALVFGSVGVGVPTSYAAALHDQMGLTVVGAVISRDEINDSLDSEAADDFVVPVSSWTIDSVDLGATSAGPVTWVTITFYADAGGTPGALILFRKDAPVVVGDTYTVPLFPPVILGPGTYWMSAVALSQAQWFWKHGTPVAGNEARWRNPGNGWGAPPACTTFQPLSSCLVGYPASDMLFRLNGTVANIAPTANDDVGGPVEIDVNPSTTTNVLANDVDDTTLSATGTVTIVTPPSDGGTAVVQGNKTITYTASGDVIGPVTYSYQVCDNQNPNRCDTAVVTVNVTTSQGGCTITGTSSGNTLMGTSGNDVICGGAGGDTLQGGGGNDVLIGGSGNDTLQGGAGNDSMFGNAGNDTLQGGVGTDFANGGPGTDTCQQNENQTGCP